MASREPAIIQAAQFAMCEEVKAIVNDRPEEVHTKDSRGRTALHHACQSNALAIVLFLLDHGAQVNLESADYLPTPLSVAVCLACDLELVHALIRKGADVNHKFEFSGQTVLHVASSHFDAAYEMGNLYECLIDHGGDVNMQDDCGFTPLHAACRCYRKNTIRVLIRKGCDEEVCDADGVSAIAHISHEGCLGAYEDALRERDAQASLMAATTPILK